MSIALEKIKSKISEDEETLEKLKDEGASLETKKMIACQLFSRVKVGKGYKIKVTMNMTYRQFVSDWGGEQHILKTYV